MSGRLLGDYKLHDRLGTGSFSVVYSATHIPTNTSVAIKAVSKEGFRPEAFNRERSILQKLDFPFCCAFFDCFEDQSHWYLVMELVEGGSISGLLYSTGKPLDEPHCRHFFCQLIAALDYLHNELGVAHRDLKPSNMMIDRFGNLRLIDFGLSNYYTGISGVLDTACGSPIYAPPEMMLNQPYTKSADLWSAGVCLYVMAVGKPPFDDVNLQQLRTRIIESQPEFPNSLTPELVELLTNMLAKDPTQRWTIEVIRRHSWFKKYYYANVMRGDFGRHRPSPRPPIGPQASSVDKKVLETMAKLNIEGSVEDDLKGEKSTPRVVAYKILKRAQVTGDLQALAEHRFDEADGSAGSPPRDAERHEGVTLMLRRMRRNRGVVRSLGEGTMKSCLPQIPVDTVKHAGLRIISSRHRLVRYRSNSPGMKTSESESEKPEQS